MADELTRINESGELESVVADGKVTKHPFLVGDNQPWDDLRFPFTGRKIDESSGRIRINYYNGTIEFDGNARFTVNEGVTMISQMPHNWKEGSVIRPHFHWVQTSAVVPNWLLAYKIYDNNTLTTIDTDYSNHTLVKTEDPEFAYTSGNLCQISRFPDIDMTGYGISDFIHYAFFRDSENTSGLFAGADTGPDPSYVFEFDVHYQIDTFGSRQEFTK